MVTTFREWNANRQPRFGSVQRPRAGKLTATEEAMFRSRTSANRSCFVLLIASTFGSSLQKQPSERRKRSNSRKPSEAEHFVRHAELVGGDRELPTSRVPRQIVHNHRVINSSPSRLKTLFTSYTPHEYLSYAAASFGSLCAHARQAIAFCVSRISSPRRALNIRLVPSMAFKVPTCGQHRMCI